MGKNNWYYHVTVQPYNCDGLGKTYYLSDCLIEELDKVTSELSQRYSWSVEQNTNNDDSHIHIALHLKSPCDQKSLYQFYIGIISKYYELSQDGYARCVDIQHKTLEKLYLLVSGYFLKQQPDRYKCVNFDDDKLEKARKEYKELKDIAEAKKLAGKTFLDPNRKHLLICKDISSFFKCLKNLYDMDKYRDLFTLENYGELHIKVLQEFKLTYDIKNKNSYLRQFTEFLISHNINTNIEKLSLVNYFVPKKEEYISNTLDRYFLFE